MPVPPIPASKMLYLFGLTILELCFLFLIFGRLISTIGFEIRLPLTVINDGQKPSKQSYE